MANLQGNGPTNEYSNRPLPVSRSSNSWMISAAVVAVIIVLGLGYMYGTSGTAEHAATTTDAPAPGAAPVTPMPSVTPAATTKQ